MVVVANAVATRVFFGVYKIQKSLLSHAPFPIRVNHTTAYPMGKHDRQRKQLQIQSGAGLRTEGEGRGQPSLVGAEFRSIWRPSTSYLTSDLQPLASDSGSTPWSQHSRHSINIQ